MQNIKMVGTSTNVCLYPVSFYIEHVATFTLDQLGRVLSVLEYLYVNPINPLNCLDFLGKMGHQRQFYDFKVDIRPVGN